MSFRTLLWEKLYSASQGASRIPNNLTAQEIIGSIAAAGIILLLCWLVVRKGFFYISENAGASRITSFLFGGSIAAAWCLGSLEWIGPGSARWMVMVMLVSTIGSITYLVWVKNR